MHYQKDNIASMASGTRDDSVWKTHITSIVLIMDNKWRYAVIFHAVNFT